MINAGDFKHRITIYQTVVIEDDEGFQKVEKTVILTPYAKVNTTRGMTIIINNSDFEKAYTNFTIRYPKTPINRDMRIDYRGKEYTIEYLNNVNEENVLLEIQAKEVTH